MNGIHDMGGMHGFGPVDPNYETGFEHDWQKRVYGINSLSLMQRAYNIDKTRFYMENHTPLVYLGMGYWERWLGMIEKLYAEAGVVEGAGDVRIEGGRRIPAEVLWEGFKKLTPPEPPALPAPLYAAGDTIVTNRNAPAKHTRLPRYARGSKGVIERYMGIFRFADAYADDRIEHQHVYSVRFDGHELWGDDCEENTCVRLEIYESYIEERIDAGS